MSVLLLIQILVLGGAIGAGLLVVVYTLLTGAPPAPMSARVRETLLKALPAHLDGMAVELGSGWGNLAIPLARRYPDNAVFGYELSPLPWAVANLWRFFAGVQNLWLYRRDFLSVPLGDASLVVCYLDPGVMRRLAEKFEQELPLDAIVVSSTFALPGWEPQAMVRSDDIYQTPIYVYRVEASAPALRVIDIPREIAAAG